MPTQKLKYNIRLGVIIILVTLMIKSLTAQESPREVFMTVALQPMIQLNVNPDVVVEFGLLEVNEDLYHVTKKPEDVMFSVESTTNWNLSVSSVQPYFTGEKNPEHKIPVEFVGYTIEDLGTNWDNGSYSNIKNMSKDTVLELSPEHTEVLTNGRRNNMGDADMNSFILHWKLLFENNALRMRNYSQYFLTDERFKVNVQLTLSETLCGTCN